jgi:hypothetical protein
MDDSPIVDPRESGRRHQRFADVETGLLGLFHFYRAYGHFLQGSTLYTVRASRWYYSALLMHADMLFTVDKGGDPQDGAALRALRDLGRRDLVLELEQRLAQPANSQDLTLAEVIRRLRNQVLVHHSFDLEEQGPALLYLGLPDELAAIAFEGLLTSVKHALAEIQEEKMRLAQDQLVLGVPLSSSLSDIAAAPERARQTAKERRQAQRLASKKGPADKPPAH